MLLCCFCCCCVLLLCPVLYAVAVCVVLCYAVSCLLPCLCAVPISMCGDGRRSATARAAWGGVLGGYPGGARAVAVRSQILFYCQKQQGG